MEILKTLTLNVELFVGTDVRHAASDLCQLADRIGVLCEANFNGVRLWARPGDDPARLVDEYFAQLASNSITKIAQVLW